MVNGPEYLPATDHAFIKQNYANGKINALEVNVFAMHYFNRINFEKKNDEILVTEFQSPYQVKIFPKDNFITASLYENENLIRTLKGIEEIKEKSPNSRTIYYLKNNEIKTYSIGIEPDLYENVDANTLSFRIFTMFPVAKKSLDEVFENFKKVFQSENLEHFEELSEDELFPFSKKDFLSFLEYDENGKVGFGIRINQEKNGEILLEAMEDNKVKKSLKVKSISELTANDNKFINDLMHQLLNDF